jgi:hypothetical protein
MCSDDIDLEPGDVHDPDRGPVRRQIIARSEET